MIPPDHRLDKGRGPAGSHLVRVSPPNGLASFGRVDSEWEKQGYSGSRVEGHAIGEGGWGSDSV